MKTIIRFLARISGAEQDIKNEVTFEIGCHMKEDAWWFSSVGYEKAYNVLHLYADSLKHQKQPPRIQYLRERICSLGNNAIDGHHTGKILECESKYQQNRTKPQ